VPGGEPEAQLNVEHGALNHAAVRRRLL
jgi:hypothetical protein